MVLPMMTQNELVANMAERTGWSQSDVRSFMFHLQDEVIAAVEHSVRVKVAGVVVGPVLKAATKARMGRNPATGEEVEISAKPAKVVLKSRIVMPLSAAELPSVQRLRKSYVGAR